MYRQTIIAGTEIFREGEKGQTAYIVEDGRVEITSERNGQRVVLAELGAGEIFGEMALIDDEVRSAGATAAEETRVVVIDRDQILNRLEQTEPVIVLLIKILLARFRKTQKELLNQDTDSVSREAVKQAAAATLSQQYESAFEGLKKEQDLKRALAENELVPYFMPIYRLSAPRQLAGFEALVRWIHPERGFVSPAEFVDMAEQSGLIRRIDMTVLDQSWHLLQEVRRLQAGLADQPLFLSVNLSGRHFADDAVIGTVADFLSRTGCPPENLELELTESILINDPDGALRILRELKGLGVLIALDDFGTGFSSLSYLHRFPIDVLKIDQVFVREMEQSAQSHKIIGAIAQLARSLDLTVIAEGVENQHCEEMLAELGCHYGQGFFYGKPRPAGELTELLKGRAA